MRKLAKRTLIIGLLCLMIIGLASCKKGDSDRADTYYAYRDGVKQDNEWIKLGKDKWSDSSGENGRLEEKDGILYGYTEASGKEDVLFLGSVMNGVFEYSFDGENWDAFYADGSNAGSKNSDSHTKDDSKTDIEYSRGGISGNAKAIGNADASGDYLYFGSYPQTLVMDDAIIGVLTSKMGALPTSENSQAWTSYNYYIEGSNEESFMWYIDLSYVGEKYRGVYFTDYRPWNTMTVSDDSNDRTYQDDNGYYKSTDTQTNVYWFKYEPIKWKIISEENGEALIICDMIIDSQDYYYSDMDREANDTIIYANNYKYSTIRAWLNEAFYNTAFTDDEKERIQTTTVDNTAKSTNPDTFTTEFNDGTNEYACSNTEDKVFLLSEQEATSSMYGFNAFVGLAEREILRDGEIGFTVKYDDCNPFGVISGDFGGIANLSKHRQEPTSYSTIDAFDSLSESFATFIKKDKEDDNYYTDLYNKAVAIYDNNSHIAFTKNVSNNNSKKSAIIGIDNDYSKVGSEAPGEIDFVTVIANMFGIRNKSEFTNYANELTKLFVQHRKNIKNGKVGNEELVNGYFYTANASAVFPIAVKNELSSTVLAYIFLIYNPPKDISEDDSYSVYVWVNDITAVLWATNYNESYRTNSVIENELYCKNLLFIPNYCRYDKVRQKKNTDYAKCQGAWTNTSSGYNEAGTGYWMLRSPVCNIPDNLQLVSNIGHAFQNNYVYYTDGGVVPALRIRVER